MAPAWWEERPGLLDEELGALRDAGIQHEIDEAWKARGILRLDLDVTVAGETLKLFAIYPDLYPYVRPEVYAPDLSLPRHQNPAQGNLCLLGRATENWTTDHTLAGHISDQLPKILRAARRPLNTPSPVPEEQQGEPASDYYTYAPGSMIFIDSAMQISPGIDNGDLELHLDPSLIGSVEVPGRKDLNGPIFRGAIVNVLDERRQVIAAGPKTLTASIGNGVRLAGRWVRMDTPPPPPAEEDLSPFVDAFFAQYPWLRDHRRAPIFGKHRLDVIGILFREELGVDLSADGWLFLVRAFRGKSEHGVVYLARTGRAGPGDLSARIPELQGLRGKTVAIVGAGGIGAPLALELAKAQVGRLRILDHDVVEPGTAVRFPFGLASAGRSKVDVISDWVGANLPYTEVEGMTWRIGGVRQSPDVSSDREVLDRLLDGADLLVDATAEFGIHYLLSEEARIRGIPFLEVATRNGAWGGIVARIPRERCWLCYQSLLGDLRTMDPPVMPAADPAPFRQPLGCADPTFTGAGFDVAEFSLVAARLAASTLLGERDYQSTPWDVGVISLRTDDGRPTWNTYRLETHSKCPRPTH
jgi:molybdopterin/thiamine biosynthesis adenylyltransferase